MDEISSEFSLKPVGVIRSSLQSRADAPRQGYEGAPGAVVEVAAPFSEALRGVEVGDALVLITWLHLGRRDVLVVHPRGDLANPLTGVFATRSPDRPNPLGLHRVKVLARSGNTLEVAPLEAIDGTPIVDIKPVLNDSADS